MPKEGAFKHKLVLSGNPKEGWGWHVEAADFIGGRWEWFASRWYKRYPTRAEAARNKPKL
jgi:hypothetical protein